MEIVESQQAFSAMFFTLVLALGVLWFARCWGFFSLPAPISKYRVKGRQVIGAFVIYILLALFVAPLGQLFFKSMLSPVQAKGWGHFFALCMVFVVLVGYLSLIRKEARFEIFWGDGPRSFSRFSKNLGMGALAWMVSYPCVLFVGLVMSWLSYVLWGQAKIGQVAVHQMRALMDYPLLFSLMIFVVVVLVPFIEELLFRGFLQSFLRKYFGRGWAIVSVALIFSAVHFSPSQGVGNVQLITDLFVLSCFLGFIYERQKTLWASFALHAIFNGFTTLLIILNH